MDGWTTHTLEETGILHPYVLPFTVEGFSQGIQRPLLLLVVLTAELTSGRSDQSISLQKAARFSGMFFWLITH
jgi:hypothetical protein